MLDIDIASRLKALRREKGLTLQDVAESAELSKSFVSQVENGSAQPSIGSLKRITEVLGITLADLFHDDAQKSDAPDDDESNGVRVVPSDKRKHLEWPNGAQAALLTPNLQGKLEVILTTYEPSQETTIDTYTHEGEELGFVMEGTFEVEVNGQAYRLEAGDSIHFPSHLPHSTRAVGDSPVKTLWVITPPSF
ncbi:MAG: cupin domain-containing protein [Acidimicrobiia bacterium]